MISVDVHMDTKSEHKFLPGMLRIRGMLKRKYVCVYLKDWMYGTIFPDKHGGH
jgi:hypothetical protein